MAKRRRQHHKGKARPRGWHRSRASSRRYANLLADLERAEKRAVGRG